MKKLSLLSFLLLLFVCGADAQAQEAERKQRIEEYKEKRAAFLTEKIGLTEEQSELFWPSYEEYHDKRMLLLRTFRTETRTFKDIELPTDKEYKEVIAKDLDMRRKEAELMQEYYTRFQKILTAKQTYDLMQAEDEFAKEYLRRRMDNRE